MQLHFQSYEKILQAHGVNTRKYWLVEVIENYCVVTWVGVYNEILHEPSGNPSGSCNISLYTPTLVTIQLQYGHTRWTWSYNLQHLQPINYLRYECLIWLNSNIQLSFHIFQNSLNCPHPFKKMPVFTNIPTTIKKCKTIEKHPPTTIRNRHKIWNHKP